ncbi:hypothetical protein FPC840_2030004 [Flavobacterium psychrophilum]|nr:hypothetical protein FPC840_2030004 [Flavobacterium psychrophilum]
MNNVNQIEEQVEDFNVEALEEKLEMIVLWSW